MEALAKRCRARDPGLSSVSRCANAAAGSKAIGGRAARLTATDGTPMIVPSIAPATVPE